MLVMRRGVLTLAHLATLGLTIACGDDDPPAGPGTPLPSLTVTGVGRQTNRYNAEIWVRGNTAYTTTWGSRGTARVPGNAILIWDVSAATPRLVDSVIVAGATTLGDVQLSDDGRIMIVPTEVVPGSLVIFDMADPRRPRQIAVYTSPEITRGIHTAELQRVDGKLYAFMSINRGVSHASRLIILDLTTPTAPNAVLVRDMGAPFIHDVFVRDGILFTALWNDGLVIWDIGGAGKGGSVANPVRLGGVLTVNGSVHNAHWFHDPVSGSKRYVFVGEEGPASGLSAASGDIHVVDISDFAQPREVAFFNVPGAGTHNFSADERRGVLYAAYYNAGVQVLDIRGELGTCTLEQRAADGRCDLRLAGRLLGEAVRDRGEVFVWGVHYVDDAVYASDMLGGVWRVSPFLR